MDLIIAEKPSMAREIAAALNATARGDGFLSSNQYLVTWSFGHLVSLAEPEAYREDWNGHWTFDVLPMIPPDFRYQINKNTENHFRLVERLINRADVARIVNACDAGREGELIFDLVYRLAQSRKPVLRLWISSLTKEDILTGFNELKPAAAYKGLRMAAHARQQADWLVGLNATRAQTLTAQRAGYRGVFSVGRVQTPTLALIVVRDTEIKNFKPVKYYQLQAEFHAGAGKYAGVWTGTDAANQPVNRFSNRAAAEMIQAKVKNQSGKITKLEVKEESENAPQLFDLTALQQTANRRFGLTAQETLSVAQSLYERKLISYPRTSSRYLSINASLEAGQILSAIAAAPFKIIADEILAKGELKLSKRFVDDSKVTDHHALIPTKERQSEQKLSELSNDERNVYELVTRRFLAAFFPAAKIEKTLIETTVSNEKFGSRGKVIIFAGWKTIESAAEDADDKIDKQTSLDQEPDENQTLPQVQLQESVLTAATNLQEKQTKAPAQFSEDTLLGAMKNAGRKLEDLELKEAMIETGLGTPATRAGIIETLIRRNFVERKKKLLVPTPTGTALINSLSVELLKSPQLTAEWESKLAMIESGVLSYSEFINQVKEMTGSVTRAIREATLKSFNEVQVESEKNLIACPLCRSLGRTGNLITRSTEKGKFMACSLGREKCGYLTDVPRNKQERQSLAKGACGLCRGVVRMRLPKEKGKDAWFPCFRYPDCKGSYRPK